MDAPADCAPGVAHGDQIILLLVRSATGTAEVGVAGVHTLQRAIPAYQTRGGGEYPDERMPRREHARTLRSGRHSRSSKSAGPGV